MARWDRESLDARPSCGRRFQRVLPRAQLLNILAPPSPQKTVEVPISLDINDRETDLGISARKVILKQTKAALELLHENAPEKIVTLGGECSVSVVPFTYLAAKYPDDIAIVWIDAHPDINLPYDEYKGYHAMALTACLGMGDEEILQLLPGKFKVSNTLIVGLRSWDEGMKERQKNLGIKVYHQRRWRRIVPPSSSG